MFKNGDKVIFIGDDKRMIESKKDDHNLIYGNEYIIFSCDYELDFCFVTEFNSPLYTINSFMSLKEYRKEKLKKINLIK